MNLRKDMTESRKDNARRREGRHVGGRKDNELRRERNKTLKGKGNGRNGKGNEDMFVEIVGRE